MKAISAAFSFLLLAFFPMAQQTGQSPAPLPPSAERHFQFEYAFTVHNAGPGGKLRVWFPMAVSDKHQQIKVVSASGDLPLRHERNSEYGDALYYAETPNADRSDYHFKVVYDVVRRESHGETSEGPKTMLARFSSQDKLVPAGGIPTEWAKRETVGHAPGMDQARAVYDFVFKTLRYDKSGTGWGRGDAIWVCDSKHGNCTDFHSLFIAMMRSVGTPGRFEIGFSIPQDKTEADIPGYHCWAEFYVPGSGWIPVDISEAWKHPERKEYYFGTHDADRIQFSMGRDLRLSPAQEGDALNYFIYPYVERDGKPLTTVDYAFHFKEQH